MTSISHYSHSLNTKFYAVKLYRNGNPVSFVCRRYKCSKASLMRWNKKFDGTKESLIDKSHRPLENVLFIHTKNSHHIQLLILLKEQLSILDISLKQFKLITVKNLLI